MKLTRENLTRMAAERILVLDGAMGTMIQTHELGEADFRGKLLADHPADLKGNNDILNLTQPEVISGIYRGYLQAGADIITTNTFNGTSVAQSDYHTSHLVRDINFAAAKLAREAADEFTAANPDRPRFVAGSLAPTNRTCSISPDVNNPGHRNITPSTRHVNRLHFFWPVSSGHITLSWLTRTLIVLVNTLQPPSPYGLREAQSLPQGRRA